MGSSSSKGSSQRQNQGTQEVATPDAKALSVGRQDEQEDSLAPLWKATTESSSRDNGSLPCPLDFTLYGARHKSRVISQILRTSALSSSGSNGQDESSSSSSLLTIETGLRGGVLLLRLADQIVAVSKGYTVYNTTPCYPNQAPSSKQKYRGTCLYEYAQLRKPTSSSSAARTRSRSHLVYHTARSSSSSTNDNDMLLAYTILPGPINSQTKCLFVGDARQHPNLDVIMAAEWTYQAPNYAVHMVRPHVDVALVLLLMLLSDLMDADAQMRDLAITTAKGSIMLT